eukprot:CAMPEP_0115165806 /NCGR_PEP_ID=MMETSP0227-20121206/73792_1 /TAXON_ID=89957 /ORGANISM="Polarella glacialis, Strain CCMP 1383" /LENGTH=542 /DNA_ID=CAMNT_0002578309 /DNA_START=35 /DNA_END=1663 /DNA_ORIENTATION=+
MYLRTEATCYAQPVEPRKLKGPKGKTSSSSSLDTARGLWLRCDLRVDDNPALRAAAEGAETLLPVYVFDLTRFNKPTLAGARKSTARRARFLLESVACMRKHLERLGSGLAVAIGPCSEAVPKLCAGCSTVVVTEGICSQEQKEEVLTAKHLKPTGGELKKVWGGSLFLPGDLGQKADDIPLMFTSFKNKCEGRGQIRNPLEAPKKLPPLPQAPAPELLEALKFLPTLEELGYPADEVKEAMHDDPRGVMAFEGGEDAALARLQKWMFADDKLKDYFEIRNGMLGDGYSSKFSPWLATGCLSPRRVWKEANRYEAERVKNKSTYWLTFEMTWRDFFIYLAWGQGDRIFKQGGITGDMTPWNGSRDKLERWKEGKTGDPLVDANMRELKATGFMSNRGRQNVASFLIFDLSVDWRYGAAHFEEYLLDYDPCSNWGNWLAAAGLTGQRVNKFNTKKQLSDYDPQREYVNHWLKGDTGGPRKVVSSEPREEKGGGKGGYNNPKNNGNGRESKDKPGRRWGPGEKPGDKSSGKKRPFDRGGGDAEW